MGTALFLVRASVLASDWMMINDADSFTTYYDKQSMIRNGGRVTAWILKKLMMVLSIYLKKPQWNLIALKIRSEAVHM
jgi:hypothetical protein